MHSRPSAHHSTPLEQSEKGVSELASLHSIPLMDNDVPLHPSLLALRALREADWRLRSIKREIRELKDEAGRLEERVAELGANGRRSRRRARKLARSALDWVGDQRMRDVEREAERLENEARRHEREARDNRRRATERERQLPGLVDSRNSRRDQVLGYHIIWVRSVPDVRNVAYLKWYHGFRGTVHIDDAGMRDRTRMRLLRQIRNARLLCSSSDI
ncbi:hypothetical protein CRG98_042539 [Punica granatum]|uniref:Uncharacterized protein n=1 Tax=Punica granatum TaxID=22663 RepID=A0A2I0HZY2_PUNGR|nr:hypothetical protein CRG98_042539 [Punica granatum]